MSKKEQVLLAGRFLNLTKTLKAAEERKQSAEKDIAQAKKGLGDLGNETTGEAFRYVIRDGEDVWLVSWDSHHGFSAQKCEYAEINPMPTGLFKVSEPTTVTFTTARPDSISVSSEPVP